MDLFSYVSIVPSIVIALGLTRLLTGVGKVLEQRHHVKNYWVHMLWSFNLFLYMVLNWWVLFRWNSEPQWSFPLLIFLLLTPTVMFLQSVVLYPDLFHQVMDFKDSFFDNRRSFFLLAAMLPPLDFLDTLLKGLPHLLAQGPIYFVTIPLMTALSLVAAFTRNQTYHKAFAVFFLINISILIAVNLNTLA